MSWLETFFAHGFSSFSKIIVFCLYTKKLVLKEISKQKKWNTFEKATISCIDSLNRQHFSDSSNFTNEVVSKVTFNRKKASSRSWCHDQQWFCSNGQFSIVVVEIKS